MRKVLWAFTGLIVVVLGALGGVLAFDATVKQIWTSGRRLIPFNQACLAASAAVRGRAPGPPNRTNARVP